MNRFLKNLVRVLLVILFLELAFFMLAEDNNTVGPGLVIGKQYCFRIRGLILYAKINALVKAEWLDITIVRDLSFSIEKKRILINLRNVDIVYDCEEN